LRTLSDRVPNRDDTVLADILAKARGADLVLWTAPVYYLLVPGQYKRFIELVDEHGGAEAFTGRYAAALTTSSQNSTKATLA
jgi:NAD(P)H-dependent FMN reductase